jgi:hypothetical protein
MIPDSYLPWPSVLRDPTVDRPFERACLTQQSVIIFVFLRSAANVLFLNPSDHGNLTRRSSY